MPESEKFPKVNKSKFNKKSFKKRYKQFFDRFVYSCKISKSKDQLNRYRNDIKEIIQIVDQTLDKDITYEIGNIYYIFGILEELKEFMIKVSNRSNEVGDSALKLIYDTINEKLSKVKHDLNENLHNPISSNELRIEVENNDGT